jgi:NADH-quinone oxidoreductase subunit J
MNAILVLSPLILLAATAAVWKARPVHAALFLALALSLNAVLYLTLGADFIGLVQFSVYVGAVAVLIVFTLLITRPADESEEIARRPKSFATGLLCVVPVLVVLLHSVSAIGMPESLCRAANKLEVAEIGRLLFTTHAPAVLALAVLLTAVLIGAALLAREPDKKSCHHDHP